MNTSRIENTISLSEKILIVDDDDSVRSLIVDALQVKQYEVESAETIESAVRQLETSYFDIIISDINFPDEELSGVDLFNICKDNYPNTAFIFFTGAPELSDALNLLKAGAADYLPKPIDLKKLYKCVDDVCYRLKCQRASPVIDSVIDSIPPEFKVLRLIEMTNSSVVLMVRKEHKYYAMKIIKSDSFNLSNHINMERFDREAKIMTSISHPNIVKVIDYQCIEQAKPFILLEYVPGKSLSLEFIQSLDLNSRLILIKKIAYAIAEIHKYGIIHRDIKPANILITNNGEPKLTDFGVSHIQGSSLTMTCEIIGSPNYMSPEAFESSKHIDERSDIFSFGLVAYFILTESPAFEGNEINQLMHNIQNTKPVRPRTLNPDIPRAIENILAGMLEKRPGKRIKDIGIVIRKIEKFLDGKEARMGIIESLFLYKKQSKVWG
jgi:serine/threonine protein kinase